MPVRAVLGILELTARADLQALFRDRRAIRQDLLEMQYEIAKF